MSNYSHFARFGIVRTPGLVRTGGGAGGPCAGWEPAIDIFERPQDLVIVVELPGCDGEAIEVTVERNTLQIRGNRTKRVPKGTLGVHQMEIPYGEFERQVPLAPGLDVDAVEAVYREGFLTVTIPRRAR